MGEPKRGRNLESLPGDTHRPGNGKENARPRQKYTTHAQTCCQHVTSSSITLLLASEVDDIMNGVDEKYRSNSISATPNRAGLETPAKPKQLSKPTPAVPPMAS